LESSWKQLLVLSGWYFGAYRRMARLRVPIGPANVVVESRAGGFYAVSECVLDTEGYFAGVKAIYVKSGPGFPYGYDVYPDDLFPVPWP